MNNESQAARRPEQTSVPACRILKKRSLQPGDDA